MRVNELLEIHSRRFIAAGTLAAVLGLAGCDAFKPPEACSVTIAPLNVTVSVNGSTPVVGTPFDCKGSTLKNKKVNYSSNNSLVATVTPDGQVIGIAVGQTQISAVADGKSASAQVTVVPEAAATVTVTPNPQVLRVNNMKQFTAVAKNSRGDVITGRTFQWATSNSSIASVDGSGNVTAHSVGFVTISATSDNVNGTASVQVTLVPLGDCDLPANRKLTVNGQYQPELILKDTAGNILSNSGRTMAWTSDNEVNATVSQTGVVTARKAGFAKITAAWPENTAIKCDITIEAVDPRIITATIQERTQTLRLGLQKQFTVVLRDSVNQIIPPGRVVTWTSVDPSVVNVTPGGIVTGISLGNGRVAVDAEGVKDTVTVNVTKIPVGKVTVSPSSQAAIQGSSVNLTAVVEDSVGTIVTDRTIEWNSSDPVRATVTPTGATTATVQTFGTGNVTITATSETRSGQSTVVIQPIPVDTIVVNSTYSAALNGVNKSFAIELRAANGTTLFNRNISVTSSNTDVAIGSANAQSTVVNVTAFQAGTTTFTIRALNSNNQPEGKVSTVVVTITPIVP